MPIIESKSQLLEYFNKGAKKQDQLLIGVEHEKFLFSGKEKKRVNYEQIKKILKNLRTFGWNLVYEKKNIIGLKRGKQQITTEHILMKLKKLQKV
jgi:gamma-glutamylcysteine synthetase